MPCGPTSDAAPCPLSPMPSSPGAEVVAVAVTATVRPARAAPARSSCIRPTRRNKSSAVASRDRRVEGSGVHFRFKKSWRHHGGARIRSLAAPGTMPSGLRSSRALRGHSRTASAELHLSLPCTAHPLKATDGSWQRPRPRPERRTQRGRPRHARRPRRVKSGGSASYEAAIDEYRRQRPDPSARRPRSATQ